MSKEVLESEDDSYIVFKDAPQKILSFIKLNAKKNDFLGVLAAFERYACECEKTIAVGPEKRAILENLVKEKNPVTVLELGTFFGYSTLVIASCLTKPNSMLYTIEIHPDFAETAKEIIEFAGMRKRIKVLTGDSLKIIDELAAGACGVNEFDLVLLDHWKLAYRRDLIKLEDLNLIGKRSVIVADNVIFPGCPGYLEYVRNNPKYESSSYPAKDAYSDVDDAMEKSVYLGK